MVTSTWVYTPKSGTINKQIELAEKFAEIWKKYGAKEVNLYALSGAQTVSYTHLTLPTNREV